MYVYFIKLKYFLFDIIIEVRYYKFIEINKEFYYYEIGYLICEFEG